jgi:hypothetical protein
MPAPASYARRQFPGAAVDTTIVSGINNTDLSVTLASATGWPTGAYTGGILVELYNVTTGLTIEKVWSTNLTGVTLTIVRAADGTTATSHAAGTGIRAIAGAIDADEANRAVNETVGQLTAAGQILVADGTASAAALQTKTSGQILQGNGTTLASVAVSGDATLAAGGALTIANDAITAAKIAADAVGTSEIAADAVTSSEIATDAVGTAEIAADAVTSSEIAANAVGASELADNAVDTAAIVALAVTAAKIANDTITATQIAADAIGSSELANNAVDTAAIAASAVTIAKLAAPPMCQFHMTALQTIPDGAWTSIIGATPVEDWDTDTMHDQVTNPGRITATTAGKYAITAGVLWESNINGQRGIRLRVNGTTVHDLTKGDLIKELTVDPVMNASKTLALAAADYVELQVFHNRGANLDATLVNFEATYRGP